MNRYITLIAIIITVLFMTVPASALELDMTEIGFPIDKIEMHGFFSQGYMKSTNNDLYGDSRDGTLDLRDFGVNFSGNLTDDLRLAAQFTGYSLGEQGGDKINLHYGYADYRLVDALGFRLGRVRVPSGLYNETRDIDMVRTHVFMPQSVYPEEYRDYYASADAFVTYGGVDMESLGFLSYQGHVGRLINDDDPVSDVPLSMRAQGLENNVFTDGHSAGAQLLWETPVQGLRTGWTWRRIDNNMSSEFTIPGVGTFPVHTPIKNVSLQVWSLEYVIDRLTLMSEYSYVSIDSVPNFTGWYAGADYALTDKFSIGGNYSRYSLERGARPGINPEDIYGHQNTVSVYGKYDITANWLIKAQVDMNRGLARYQGFSRSADDELESMLFSVKTTWSF